MTSTKLLGLCGIFLALDCGGQGDTKTPGTGGTPTDSGGTMGGDGAAAMPEAGVVDAPTGGDGAAGMMGGDSGGDDGGSAGLPDAAGAGSDAVACDTSPGKALQFSGTIVDLMTGDLGTDLPGGDVPRTIEVWVKYTSAQSWTAEHSILEIGKAQGGQNKVFGFDNSGYSGTTAEFGPYTNGYSDNNHPNGVFVPNIPQIGWIHQSWSYTGNHGTLSFTVNGTEYPVITAAGAPTLSLFQGIVTLAASQNFGTAGFDGVIDDVRIWSIAKTPAEVARDMKVVLKGTEPGLVAYYRFSEGAGTFTDDVTMKPSHRLSVCTAVSAACPAVNAANPTWVDSDLPGPFTCAP